MIVCKIGRSVQPDAFFIRREVFMKEQGYENEFDEVDDFCVYVVLYDGERAVATGRFYQQSDTAVLGRIAVLKDWRGKNLGRKVVEELEKAALSKGALCLALTAQEYAVPFYEKCGFSLSDNEILYDEGNPHRRMEKNLV